MYLLYFCFLFFCLPLLSTSTCNPGTGCPPCNEGDGQNSVLSCPCKTAAEFCLQAPGSAPSSCAARHRPQHARQPSLDITFLLQDNRDRGIN